MKRVAIIGAGFAGVSAAAYLARSGYEVTVYEKNERAGGRAGLLERDGFSMDTGPSWYWMPAEHDRWFTDMGERREDFYALTRLDPSYKIYFGSTPPAENANEVAMPAGIRSAQDVFERYQAGGGRKLERFLRGSRARYETAMSRFIYRNYPTAGSALAGGIIRKLPSLGLLRSYRTLVNRSFTHPYLRKILEFPVVFLGSFAPRTPGVYTLMNHIDFGLGTWYPDGGFARVVQSMREVAERQGARFRFNCEVTALAGSGRRLQTLTVRHSQTADGPAEVVNTDIVLANADYVHVETGLLPPAFRSIPETAWKARSLAPAVLTFHLGFRKRLPFLEHHTFFFDANWDAHFQSVYGRAQWPDNPLFYVHTPSRTDSGCAPEGCEAVFVLIPCAPGLEDTAEIRGRYQDLIMNRLEAAAGEPLRGAIAFAESSSIRDYTSRFHAYRGNAFGLGQTLDQTAYFRPPNRSRRVRNLYFAGHYTIPGTGTTMSMISGRLAAERIARDWPAE